MASYSRIGNIEFHASLLRTVDLSAFITTPLGIDVLLSPCTNGAPPQMEFGGATETSPLTSRDAGPALCKAVVVVPKNTHASHNLRALTAGGATTGASAKPPSGGRMRAKLRPGSAGPGSPAPTHPPTCTGT